MSITYLTGDATLPQGEGLRIVAHIVSDAFVPWSATKKPTFAKALGEKYPEAEENYLSWPKSRVLPALGKISIAMGVTEDVDVVNMLAQRGLRSAANPVPLDIPALGLCLTKLFQYAQHYMESPAPPLPKYNPSIHMPRIGAGFGGENWRNIEPVILAAQRGWGPDVPVFVYDLPKKGV